MRWSAGAERHAELIVLSDVLHEADRAREAAGAPPLTLDEARDLAAYRRLRGFLRPRAAAIRWPAQPAHLCESCIVALVTSR